MEQNEACANGQRIYSIHFVSQSCSFDTKSAPHCCFFFHLMIYTANNNHKSSTKMCHTMVAAEECHLSIVLAII